MNQGSGNLQLALPRRPSPSRQIPSEPAWGHAKIRGDDGAVGGTTSVNQPQLMIRRELIDQFLPDTAGRAGDNNDHIVPFNNRRYSESYSVV